MAGGKKRFIMYGLLLISLVGSFLFIQNLNKQLKIKDQKIHYLFKQHENTNAKLSDLKSQLDYLKLEVMRGRS